MKSAQRGLSGVDVVIVGLAVVILGGVLIFGTGIVQKNMRDAQREQMMKELVVALEGYGGENGSYPIAGSPILGGGVVAGSNDFNSMVAALGQGKFLDPKKLVDPAYGALFGGFNGTNGYVDGNKFVSDEKKCQKQVVEAQVDVTGTVAYSYVGAPDGESFVMCLVNEEGQTKVFTSPKY